MNSNTTPAAVRVAAELAALLITITLWAMDHAYWMGHRTGSALHCANDRITRLWVRLWVAPILPAVPVFHPLAVIAAEMAMLPRRNLSTTTGARGNRNKSQLIACHLAS